MKSRIIEAGPNGTVKWDIDKPCFSAPEIKKTFMSKGTRMYKTKEGKTFLADVYDAMFNVKKGIVLKEKRFLTGRSF
jgi:hypothetical protein